jgi:hypothetical protein
VITCVLAGASLLNISKINEVIYYLETAREKRGERNVLGRYSKFLIRRNIEYPSLHQTHPGLFEALPNPIDEEEFTEKLVTADRAGAFCHDRKTLPGIRTITQFILNE